MVGYVCKLRRAIVVIPDPLPIVYTIGKEIGAFGPFESTKILSSSSVFIDTSTILSIMEDASLLKKKRY